MYAMMTLVPLSCSNAGETAPDPGVEVKTFEVLCRNAWIPAQVDPASHRIDISGVENTALITDVRYTLTGEGALYPTPESWLGEWAPEESFLLKWGLTTACLRPLRCSRTERKCVYLC